MNDAAARARAEAPVPRRGRFRKVLRWCGVVALVVLLALVALWFALPPERLARMAIARLAEANGLAVEIGDASLTLRGEPTLVLRDVAVRDVAGDTAWLRADRALLSLPWSTLRNRDAAPRITRIELDAPQLDLPALQRWLAARPESDATVTWPVLTRGLRIRDGVVHLGDGARLEAIAVDLPRFARGVPLRAQVAGRYAGDGLSASFDVAVALQRPGEAGGAGVVGTVVPAGDGWSLPSHVALSGPVRLDDAGRLRLSPARVALSSRWRSGGSDLPFVLGLHGRLRIGGDGVAMAPLRAALRSDDPLVPTLDAGGRVALVDRLLLELDGRIARWPEGWPALPPPLADRAVPADVAVGYLGDASLDDVLRLRVARDGASFDGSLRLPEMLAWMDAGASGSPVPPLRGRVVADAVEISGATLHGVEVEFLDDSMAEDASPAR